VNNYRFRLSADTSVGVQLPIMSDWDMGGTNDTIEIFENEILKKIINPIDDFETVRYSHQTWNDSIDNIEKTSINYEFYFYSASTNSSVTAETNSNNWVVDYRANGLTTRNIYFDDKVFSNSFFKLDFYDTKNTTNQQIYLTIIIPSRNGETLRTNFGYKTINILKPKFLLDFVGNKEGYYLYWLKSTEFIEINRLYMTAKYFDAQSGQFIKMMTRSQGELVNKFNFNQEDYFYYVVDLDLNNYTYNINDESIGGVLNRVGTTTTPIKWYEYVNPQ
jgi:hypothetical protein